MSDMPAGRTTPIEVVAHGITVLISEPRAFDASEPRSFGPETEAHMPRAFDPAAEPRAFEPETEAHMPRAFDPAAEPRAFDPETEAHVRLGTREPEIEAYARLSLSFPADAPAQTLVLRYTPAERAGDRPGVELRAHGR